MRASASVCVCVRVCRRVWAYMHVCVSMHAFSVCVCVHADACARVRVCMRFVCARVYMFVGVHALCMCEGACVVCARVGMWMHVHVCEHACVVRVHV